MLWNPEAADGAREGNPFAKASPPVGGSFLNRGANGNDSGIGGLGILSTMPWDGSNPDWLVRTVRHCGLGFHCGVEADCVDGALGLAIG